MKASHVSILHVVLDLLERCSAPDLDRYSASKEKALSSLTVSGFDDSIETLQGVRPVLDDQVTLPCVGQALGQRVLGAGLRRTYAAQDATINRAGRPEVAGGPAASLPTQRARNDTAGTREDNSTQEIKRI